MTNTSTSVGADTPRTAPENLADIVREMRTAYIDMQGNTYYPMPAALEYADRIEAAAKREATILNAAQMIDRMTTQTAVESVGNAAAMREALEHVEKLTREFIVGNYYRTDFPQMILGAIVTALSAPARNCDRFETAQEAFRAFRESKPGCQIGGCQPCQFAPEECAIRWLFAPAEGGAK